MKKYLALLSIAGMVMVVYSCKKNTDKLTAAAYLDLPATPYVYENSNNTTVEKYNQKATLGRVLFYDTHLSVNNAISCGSCHKQAMGFADNVPLSLGFEGRLTKRNSKSIVNISGDGFRSFSIDQPGSPLFWDGREEIVKNLVARPISNHVEMGIDDVNVLPAKLSKLSYYSSLFQDAYGDMNINMDRLSECVALFMASIQSKNARFDRYVNTNDISVFSSLELKGMSLFSSKYHCENCHHITQNMYTTEDFRDIGLDESYTDLGRGAVSTSSFDNGKFRVPSLHNVTLSAPYMHDGRFKTLSEVIDHYSKGIMNSQNLDSQLKDSTGHAPRQMNITDDDKQAIIAFLGTMTDYSLVTDPKFSNPFKLK